MQDLTVALVQTDLHWEAIDANLTQLDRQLDHVAPDVDLVVLPEMFSTGFSMAAPQLAESMSGKAVSWLQVKAAEHKAVVAGSLMIEEQGRYFNRLVWARPDGSLAGYDKKHLFRYAGEHTVYTAGDVLETWSLRGWRIRPFICYDLRFPIWCRNLNQAYDLALFVANWPAKRTFHWRQLLTARAIENQSYVIGVNRVGTDGNGHHYDGDSAALAPTGESLFEAGAHKTVHTVTLSRETLDAYRKAFPAWKDADTEMLSER